MPKMAENQRQKLRKSRNQKSPIRLLLMGFTLKIGHYENGIIAFSVSMLFFVSKERAVKKSTNDNKEQTKCSSVGSKKLQMYKMSEMAALMEQMYVDNQRLKDRIKHGDTIGKFPQHFLKYIKQ